MAEIRRRNKPLSVYPLKSSQTLGAALATLGIDKAIPLFHGSQGCTAFAKVFFVRHYREPIPLQTTAMDQIATVMGGDENLTEALATLCGKSQPEAIMVITTGLSETQGTDINRVLKDFRAAHPEYDGVEIAFVSAPDFKGSFESGYAAAIEAMIAAWVPPVQALEAPAEGREVALLAGASLTPGDVEWLEQTVRAFDLEPVILPNVGDSLDGHVTDEDFSPLTTGGLPVARFKALAATRAVLAVGPSMFRAGRQLAERIGRPLHRFECLTDMASIDEFLQALSTLSGRPVPARFERHRRQLQDAMMDAHFVLGQERCALAGEPDMLLAFCRLLQMMGMEIPVAVTTRTPAHLTGLPVDLVQEGDLEDLLDLIQQEPVELLIGNSHVAQIADKKGLPLLRAGFPQWDRLGADQRTWIGYQGVRQTIFELGNLLLESLPHSLSPYHARLRTENLPQRFAANG